MEGVRQMTSNYLIVVGVDGSDGGRRALDWAAREAATRGGAVQAVVAWRWDGIESGPMTAGNPTDEEERARAILDREIQALTARRGSSSPVAAEVVEGRAADVLTRAARSAELLVLGSHGHSRIRHTVLGSVSEECVSKACCPVVVIPVPVPVPHATAEPALPV
ncbi:Nucleotide-binding universal stress protein, UspA family [Micromonospora coriariae]|uniref:Nucleotide-binding universal stress protein, UspA family n=2 Tax=Micromonospora TaxID=1873 RepID=A0A1C4X5A4_9ACTN|nr:Nucleotide-binding universal stress protein, UspA family [Micromonospora coriariae]